MLVRIGRVCALLMLVGCGGKQAAKPPAAPTSAPEVQIAEEPPDLSPVARPGEVVVVGRIARPRLFVETLGRWSSAPIALPDLLPSDMRAAEAAVLWDAPVEMLVALDPNGEGMVPKPLLVASIGLKSLEAGLDAAEGMRLVTRKLAPGVHRVGELEGGSCAMAVSVGAAPARLVCGKRSKDVDALLPYATRGLPTEPRTGADFELTLDAAPLQARYGSQISGLRLLGGVAMREVALDAPRFDRAISDAIYGGIDEAIGLFGDLQQVRLEARLDAARNVLLGSAELRLKGEASWLAGTLAATKPVPVPSTLPRLPTGTSLAMFSAAMPAERYAAINRMLGDLAEGYLEHEKVPEASRKRVRQALEPWLQKMPESFGFAVPSRQSNRDGSLALHPDTVINRIAEPSPRIMAAYTSFAALLQDRGFKRWVQEKTKLTDKAWPKVSKKTLKVAGFKSPATVWEVTADLKALGASSSSAANMIEKWLPLAKRDEVARYTFFVLPDGQFTYVGTGDGPEEVAHALAEHRKTEPGAFFARPARSEPVTSAGFVTLAYLVRALERSNDMPELRKALAGAPNHGETPIPMSTTVGPGVARFDIEVPAAALTDAGSMATSASGGLRKRAAETRAREKRGSVGQTPGTTGKCPCPPDDAACTCL
jgi:hypothetical protein